MGFEDATPIQANAIPHILAGKDLIACAQTGTGKTAAFLIPLINELMFGERGKTRALIIAPTRELAIQIDNAVMGLAYFASISSVAIYGGGEKQKWAIQKDAIKRGVDIIIATPGRLKMHHAMGYLDFSNIEMVVLDEADKMLDMGFYNDIISFFSLLPKERQTLMFSATMPPKIKQLAKNIMNEPEEVILELSKPAEGIEQVGYVLYEDQKLKVLEHLMKTEEVESMIVFSSRKSSVDQMVRKLKRLGLKVGGIHSDKEQSEREETLREFRNKKIQVVVATDILSRGIDIDGISHVLNYDVPQDAEDYVHRIGRTARADATGKAITFINEADQFRFFRIEELIEQEVPKAEVPAELGETPEYSPRRRNRGHHGRNHRRNDGRGRNQRRSNNQRGRSNGRDNRRNDRSDRRDDRRDRRGRNHSNQRSRNDDRQRNRNDDRNSQRNRNEEQSQQRNGRMRNHPPRRRNNVNRSEERTFNKRERKPMEEKRPETVNGKPQEEMAPKRKRKRYRSHRKRKSNANANPTTEQKTVE